jgi:L-ascorbate metabolism protein UlaG (beta-lactamase superfamily)
MRIKHYGHASFLIAGDNIRIITDPYLPELIGYDPITDPADVVIMSSATDPAHSHAAMIPGNPAVINAIAITETAVEIRGIRFEAVATMESLIYKNSPGQNAMYRFTVEGIAIGHMGDVGNPLNDTQLAFFQDIDILFALTGGPPTIELDDLDKALAFIQPKITIPMHYKTQKSKVSKILPVDDFMSRYPKEIVHYWDRAEIKLDRPMLPKQPQIYVLRYAN